MDTEGNSRKLQRKRMRNAPPNMKAMLKELKGFNGMVLSLALSLHCEEEREKNRCI